MAPARIAGIDLSIGLSVLLIVVVELIGEHGSWTRALGLYNHQVVDEFPYALFLFISGIRTTFISTSVFSDGPRLLRYYIYRSAGVLILGVLAYFAFSSLVLIHLGIMLLATIILSQLNSNILYFTGFMVLMLSLTLPLTVSSSPTEALENSEWWSDALYLRNDAFIPLAMFYLAGMIYARSDFMSQQWQRFIRIVSVLVIIGTVLTHFASIDYFRSSYLLEVEDHARMFPITAFVYRPIYLMGIIPLVILILQLSTYLSMRKGDNLIVDGLSKIGQFHLSFFLLAIALTVFLGLFISPETPNGLVRWICWGSGLLIFLLITIFRKQIRTAPVEWLVQRFY